ncbi:MAG: dihydrolipoyl dehydrogenase [Chloroflexi bacterium]|jgi:mycothione reductase|nr:dihydrolipoyl dehydrogenase [Chloroflexota bacterium]MBT7080609.1 dihydrolipoyl dehydrogenase [Chloroflexota bacterium]MBT7289254.1 dihydrolipoyl dehydrogenase [Chloroflexota bacterium]
MKEYDLIAIGSGAGMSVLSDAVDSGAKAALVDKGPMGGTCLNLGCIPSKMLIYSADRVVEIQESAKLGITAEVKGVDFKAIMERMRTSINGYSDGMRQAALKTNEFDYYEGEGHFVSDYTLEVNGQQIKGDRIIIASGMRPFVPPVQGIDTVDYLTNESALQLTEKPDSLIIVGGGYIGVEFAHFFAAMGTKVTIIEMGNRLVANEDSELSDLLRKKLGDRVKILTVVQADQIRNNGDSVTVVIKDLASGKKREVTAQRLMMAVGRRSNADTLKIENTSIEVDKRGYIKVNDYLETNVKNIWAIGDANGASMFRHTANKEADLVSKNIFENAGTKMDYTAIPHAVFSHPQIAGVGLTEQAARKDYDVYVGKASYFDVAKGEAMMETDGFAKAIVEKGTLKILGFHIIGPYAPILVQEVVNAIESGGHLHEISAATHIHPALTELIESALGNLE